MATPQLSPGVLVREVDLTVGRADNVLDNIGAIAGPFEIGPVDEITNITTEQELINTFGKPISTDTQYEYWMSASNFLSYGGVLKVVRTGDANHNNANAGVGIASTTSLVINNYDDYTQNHKTDNTFTYGAKNPGSWGNNLKVCTIDDFADQTIGLSTDSLVAAGATIGYGVTATLSGVTIPGSGTTSTFNGFLKGIVVGLRTDSTGSSSEVDIRVVSRVETVGGGSTETSITYQEGTSFAAFGTGGSIHFVNNSGSLVTPGSGVFYTPATAVDWYDQQTLGLTNATTFWKSLAPRPTTNVFVSDRQGKNDGIHVAVVDDDGSITGIKGNILETHLGLSKAQDAISNVNAPERIYYKDYLADNSANIYAGFNPSSAADLFHNTSPRASGFATDFSAVSTADGLWGLDAQGVTFSVVGNVNYTLGGGVDYSATGGMKAELSNLITSYNLFNNKDETEVDYLIMGPGCETISQSQAKANQLISIANERKDCVAVVGPHRTDLVGETNTTTQTNNLINYFSPLTSSSYAVFDSGYKSQYDRFNNEFRYLPCNADVAGLMCRTNLIAYPWFSPAGQQRGVINNAVKLAYNPTKAQRDRLYPARINSFITTPGIGTLLFGDKTALGYASAFDRINVRRLFLTIERVIGSAAKSQLFEQNDEAQRSLFLNIVEPYLRDVQGRRGVTDFLVKCDADNNPPESVDRGEFYAEIFVKPTRTINYITLTFTATRTGVAFTEVAS